MGLQNIWLLRKACGIAVVDVTKRKRKEAIATQDTVGRLSRTTTKKMVITVRREAKTCWNEMHTKQQQQEQQCVNCGQCASRTSQRRTLHTGWAARHSLENTKTGNRSSSSSSVCVNCGQCASRTSQRTLHTGWAARHSLENTKTGNPRR
jgi:formate hydrogenlyase subunit 6/NADH:ubiquinone oxidoreductase subunit I